MTTGEGGALLINDEKYYEKALKMRNLDFDNNRRFQHDNLYWNYRMGGLQAALGLSQINNLKNTIDKKKKQGKIYNNYLEPISDIQLPLVKHQGIENHYWVYGIVLKSKSRDDLSKHLYDMGIQTRNFFGPYTCKVHCQKNIIARETCQFLNILVRMDYICHLVNI